MSPCRAGLGTQDELGDGRHWLRRPPDTLSPPCGGGWGGGGESGQALLCGRERTPAATHTRGSPPCPCPVAKKLETPGPVKCEWS